MSVLSRPLRGPAVVAAAACLLLPSCQREAEPSAPTIPAAPAPVEQNSQTPVLSPALDRRAILSAIAQAASNYAAGARAEPDTMAGRPFDISLVFGCGGPTVAPPEGAGDGLARWSWQGDREAIRLGLTPEDWTRSALIADASQDAWEAVEGFWIPRPWMSAEGCPSIKADPLASGPVAPSPQTAGLAAVFEKGGSRLGRRNGRAYAHVVRSSGDTPSAPPEGGYTVRMQGRIAAFPDGRAIRCRATHPDQRPVCVAAVQLDRVAFQTAGGDVLSEWRPG